MSVRSLVRGLGKSSGYAALVMLLILVLVFVLVRVAGDPLEMMLPDSATEADRARFAAAIGLDKPIPTRFAVYLLRLMHGDFGVSLRYGEPAMQLVLERLPATVQLAAAALLTSLLLGTLLGVASALKHGTWIDSSLSALAVVGKSMPSFFLGMLLIVLLAVHWELFPVSGGGSAWHLVLPALALGSSLAAQNARLIRGGLIATLSQDYVRAARARGLDERAVVLRYALGNALLPLFTVTMLQIPQLMGGVLVIEALFAWPGMGQLTVAALGARDMPLVQASVVFLSAIVVFTNVLTDLLYRFLDPRIRAG